MKISILTMVTNPEQRQDKWQEALKCYLDFADEVVVVNGGESLGVNVASYLMQKPFGEGFEYDLVHKVKEISLPWPYEWNWAELPRHLNEGLKHCTGDWVIKMDIDQFFHEKDFTQIRFTLSELPPEILVGTFQKMSMSYGKKYYEKGEQPIAFRRLPCLSFGETIDKKTDLCNVVDTTGVKGFKTVGKTIIYLGREPKSLRTRISFWNYDYFFKTQGFTRKEFWRFSRAYNRYFNSWAFGEDEEASFKVFLNMMKGRHDRSPYEYKLEIHPRYIRKAVEELKPEQFGYNGFGLI